MIGMRVTWTTFDREATEEAQRAADASAATPTAHDLRLAALMGVRAHQTPRVEPHTIFHSGTVVALQHVPANTVYPARWLALVALASGAIVEVDPLECRLLG